jgi:hypothetical protein
MREIERRISTIKNLIQGSRVGNNSRITSIIDDLDEVVHVSTINPERRKRLFKILYMSRGFDSFLSEYSGVRNTSLGNYLVTISQQGRRTSTGTVLDVQFYQREIVNKRNRFMHEAGSYPSGEQEVNRNIIRNR